MERHGLWQVSLMECAICNAEWVGVHPMEAERLECPQCGYMNAAPEPEEADVE